RSVRAVNRTRSTQRASANHAPRFTTVSGARAKRAKDAGSAVCSAHKRPRSAPDGVRTPARADSRVAQTSWSIESPQLLHFMIAVLDIRTIVECSPQFGHTEVSSKRCRQYTHR